MPKPIHHTDLDDSDALRQHLIAEHNLAADDVPRTRDALDGVHDRIHRGVPVPCARATHRSDQPDEHIPAEAAGAVDAQLRSCATRFGTLSRQGPDFAAALVDRHCRDLRAILTSTLHTEPAEEANSGAQPAMTGQRLRDVLVAVIHADDTHGLSARPVGMLLSRGRHALDITDHDGRVWRVDVHDQPRVVM